jgi:hypothetical protein
MCDFSLHAVRSRPAEAGDKLTTRMFNLGTGGFCAPEDHGMAVCLLPGTELSFADEVRRWSKWPNAGNRVVAISNPRLPKTPNKEFTKELIELLRQHPKGMQSYFTWLSLLLRKDMVES